LGGISGVGASWWQAQARDWWGWDRGADQWLADWLLALSLLLGWLRWFCAFCRCSPVSALRRCLTSRAQCPSWRSPPAHLPRRAYTPIVHLHPPRTAALFTLPRPRSPPEDIGAAFYPRLGAYSSLDSDVIDNHMLQLAQAGVGIAAVSWCAHAAIIIVPLPSSLPPCLPASLPPCLPPPHTHTPHTHLPPGTGSACTPLLSTHRPYGGRYPRGLADDHGMPAMFDPLLPAILDAAHARGLAVSLHLEPYDKCVPRGVRVCVCACVCVRM